MPDIQALDGDQLKILKDSINERLIELGELYDNIKSGSKGENVRLLQERLAYLGYYTVAPTGTWDKASIAAMKAYEKAAGVKTPDGNATIAEQTAIFAANAVAKPTAKPTASPNPRTQYKKFDYKKVFRNPENFIGDKVKIPGTVVQVMGSRNEGYEIRLATRGKYNDVIYCVILPANTPDYNILDGDKITVYAVVLGDHSYTSTLGQVITLPLLSVDFMEMTKTK